MLSKDRQSTHITGKMAGAIIVAAAQAYISGFQLNRFVTVHVPGRDHLAGLFRRMTDWLLDRTGLSARYVYVLEKSRGRLHAHILIHVPEIHARRFFQLMRGWLSQAGIRFERDVLRSIRIRHSGLGDNSLKYARKGLMGLLRYMLKGIEPRDAERFGIRPKAQGIVTGKRTGFSESLSPKRYLWRVYTFEKFPGIRVAGHELRMRHMLELAWGDQETGEYDPRVHFPLPMVSTSKRVIIKTEPEAQDGQHAVRIDIIRTKTSAERTEQGN